ncbi:UNVERIFIED_ORG: hypothetical protein BDK47_11652 [Anoxybacillus amylolyticus]
MKFFRGCLWGVALSIPLWAAIIYGGWWLIG